MNNGVLYGLPAEQYFAEDRINNSGLKLINKSPLHYKTILSQQNEPSKALIIGSAVHCSVLENEEFFQRYAVAPKIDKRTNQGKQQWAELESSGKIIIAQDDFQLISSISESVKNNDTAAKLLSQGHPEVTVYTDMHDVPAKCRIDWYRTGIICDLKTTDDASPEGFAKSCANYGYAMQAAWYLDCCESAGVEAHTFIFIAVEKSEPFAVATYELTPESLEFGRAQYRYALNRYKNCLETGNWFGYSQDIQQLSLPAWAMKDAA